MSKEKSATDFDQAAERPSRPKPTNRVSTPYNVVEAHGVTNPEFTKDQHVRKHEQASDKDEIAKGQIVVGEDGADAAKRRFKAIHDRRKETAATFDKHRKKSSSI
jgi:hypothetical protein